MEPLTRALAQELRGGVLRVEIPAHDVVAWVCAVTALELLSWSELSDEQASCRLVACAVCNEAGVRLFEPGPEGVAEVEAWPATLLQPILRAALEINGLGSDALTPGN